MKEPSMNVGISGATSAAATSTSSALGPWEARALAQLREWDPAWAEAAERVTQNPWKHEVLPRKTVELVGLAVNAACTNLNPEGTRRHIRAALEAGASREEILTVLKMASFLGIHTCSLGAPILLEEAKAADVRPAERSLPATPVCDKVRASGGWNEAWTPFYNLDPEWTEQFMAAGVPIYSGAVLSPKLAELLSIAFDASYTRVYVSAGHAASHQSSAEARRDDGRDHGGAEALCDPRRAGLQSRSTHLRRGARQLFAAPTEPRRLKKLLETPSPAPWSPKNSPGAPDTSAKPGVRE